MAKSAIRFNIRLTLPILWVGVMLTCKIIAATQGAPFFITYFCGAMYIVLRNSFMPALVIFLWLSLMPRTIERDKDAAAFKRIFPPIAILCLGYFVASIPYGAKDIEQNQASMPTIQMPPAATPAEQEKPVKYQAGCLDMIDIEHFRRAAPIIVPEK